MLNYYLSELVSCIKVGYNLKKLFVYVKFNLKLLRILNLLYKDGFIRGFFILKRNNVKYIKIYLKYDFNNKSVINIFRLVSKPSCRKYYTYKK